jgi:hypothetical protein
MASVLMRFQEHYESPKFAGKVFTRKEFRQFYKGPKGKFSYFSDWDGFNFPATVFTEFLKGSFAPLTGNEAAFFRRVALEITGNSPDYYVIAVAKDSESNTLFHESTHALYYVDPIYRRKVRLALLLHPFLTLSICRRLLRLGYGYNVLLDETNAYLNSESDFILNGISNPARFNDLRNILGALHRQHGENDGV